VQGFAAVREQRQSVFQTHEVAVAQVKPVAAAFIRMRVLALEVDPLSGEPLAELGELPLNHRLGRQVVRGALGSGSGRLQHGASFHPLQHAPAAAARMCACQHIHALAYVLNRTDAPVLRNAS